MPLHDNAERLIRSNFAMLKRGNRPRPVEIGYLTEEQAGSINAHRRSRNFEDLNKGIMFVGKHVYESRILRDGYTINDVLKQIESALDPRSKLIFSIKMTVIQNPVKRQDGYGNQVTDQAVLECSVRFPYPELNSVIPKNDHIKPAAYEFALADELALAAEAATPILEAKDEGSHNEAAPFEMVTNPPG